MKNIILLGFLTLLMVINPKAFGCAEQTEEGLGVIETLVGDYKYKNYVYRLNSSVCDRLEDHSQELYYKLLKEEVMAIYSYTTNDIYKKLNQTLRNGRTVTAAMRKKYRPIAKIITSGLKKLPKYKGDVIRFQGKAKDKFTRWRPAKPGKPDNIKTLKAFTSTSKKLKGFCFSGSAKLKIKSKNGRFIGMMSNFPHESEVLFPPNSKFKVTKYKAPKKGAKANCHDEDTLHVIWLEEV